MMEFLASPETWVAVAFIIFVAAAAKPMFRAIAGGLDARAAKIKAQLDEARALRDEAQKLLDEHRRRQQEALREAEAIVAHGQAEAERLRRETAANLEAAFARREKMSLDKIAQAESQAVADVRHHAVDIAIAAAARLLADSIDAAKGDQLIQQAIAELDRKLH